jgi:1,2-dihydroxy-3-keto-5-methylthiopentene dioxygenase
MVRVWYHDNIDSDQRLPHEGKPCAVEAVQELGLFAANITDQDEVDRIAIEKGYVNRDEVNQYCSDADVISLPSLQKL